MKFNEKIVRLRKIRGITQDEFASAVGVSRQAVYKWESGQSYPEVAKLLEIKLLFNISIDDLLDDNFDIAMPEKKKRKRLPKAEVKKTAPELKPAAEPVVEPVVVATVEEEEPTVVVEQIVEAPVAETVISEVAPVTEEMPEAVKEESAPVIEEAQEEIVDDKKRGFFGRLFGRK